MITLTNSLAQSLARSLTRSHMLSHLHFHGDRDLLWMFPFPSEEEENSGEKDSMESHLEAGAGVRPLTLEEELTQNALQHT